MSARKKITNKRKIDRIVIGTCVYFVSFMIVAWVTFWVKGEVPDTLVQFGSGAGILELVLTAAIEIFSNKKGDSDGKID